MDNKEEDIDLNDAVQKTTYNKKCPSCGAELVFSPSDSKLKCPFCQSEISIDFSRKAKELDFSKIFEKNNDWADETCVYQCKNCGVKEIVSKNEIAKNCSFCGTPNVVKTDELSGLRPNAVVPFKLDKEQAAQAVITWAKKRFYTVRSFKKSVKPEDMNGLYEPAFTFDSDTETHYSGVLGKYHTKTKRVNGKTVTTRELRYFSISGTYNCAFDDVLIEASSNINQGSIDKLKPFNTNDSQEYNETFLLGFRASQYSKEPLTCWDEAVRIIDTTVKNKILHQYSYDVVKSYSSSTDYYNKSYKYILLPLYLGFCAYRNKHYNFYVNGKSGKVTGKTPISAIKVSITVFVILAIIVGIFLFYLYSK